MIESIYVDCQLENKINSLEISDKLKNLMIGLMTDKENEDSSENYESEEDNQILSTPIFHTLTHTPI